MSLRVQMAIVAVATAFTACGGDRATSSTTTSSTNRGTFASTDVPKSLVPNSFVPSDVAVSGMSGRVSELTLRVRISGWTNDATLALVSPDGGTSFFYDWGALVGTTAASPAELVFTTRAGSTAPGGTKAGELLRLLGRAPNGTWQLRPTNEIKGFRCPASGRGCVLVVERWSLELVTQ